LHGQQSILIIPNSIKITNPLVLFSKFGYDINVSDNHMPKKFSKSVRKYIRQEKARFRREIPDFAGQKKSFQELYKRFSSLKSKTG